MIDETVNTILFRNLISIIVFSYRIFMYVLLVTSVDISLESVAGHRLAVGSIRAPPPTLGKTGTRKSPPAAVATASTATAAVVG